MLHLTGKQFGRLEVTGLSHIDQETGRSMWLCTCRCGGARTVQGTHLKMGWTKSCGCINSDRNKKRPYEAIYNGLVRAGLRRDKSVDLTYEQFVSFTKQHRCHYCSAEVRWSKYNGQELRNQGYNLDRMDNSRGYSLGNLVVCCKRCNQGKRDLFSYEEWFGMTKYLREQDEQRSTSSPQSSGEPEGGDGASVQAGGTEEGS